MLGVLCICARRREEYPHSTTESQPSVTTLCQGQEMLCEQAARNLHFREERGHSGGKCVVFNIKPFE